MSAEGTISAEGTLMMMDDVTPHTAIVVQAVIHNPNSEGEPVVAATTLSDELGKYRFINLRAGKYHVRCYTPGEYIYYGQEASSKGIALTVERDRTLKNIDFRFPPIKKGTWRHYTRMDGLAHNTVSRIYVDPYGFMWLGTDGGGISRFDGEGFTNFNAEDGLPPFTATWAIHRDPDGVMWFGVFRQGVYCYDGKRFTHFGQEDTVK